MRYTAKRVTDLRNRLGMSPESFAAVFGFSLPSLYRWQANPKAPAACAIGTRRLLTAAQTIISRGRHTAKELGDILESAMETEGHLYALHRLLAMHFEDRSE